MYVLTRDDGVELRVSGSTWEAALELGYLFGWRPAGTESPRGQHRRSRPIYAGSPGSPRAPAWDGQDYFSRESQHVRRDDARALAVAVQCALSHVPDDASQVQVRRDGEGIAAASPVPSRESAIADGLSLPARTTIQRLVHFADSGGFTISGEPR